ncbi:MAG: hypothetical protein SP1CHLAM54_16450 [Chlamydiia bacterium]|nr:hypothetical protein [Chlamydiia bacterium]MCH9616534.1 hypothetical protein [Chlamydiia bacterium]MCH9629264.1 hypothetical protein [Chlamydiia bacterium]
MYLILMVLLFFPLAAKPLNVRVTSEAAVLINADNGAILFEKNADKQLFPASITKVATLGLALKKIVNLEREVMCPPHLLTMMSEKQKAKRGYQIAPYLLESDGTSYGIKKGEILKLKHVIYGMMYCSGNDASNLLAYHASGSVSQFMNELNLALRELGCTNTKFHNPHGLHHPEHYSTARDMALIARETFRDRRGIKFCSLTQHTRPKTNKQDEKEMRPKNVLLREDSPYYYTKALGMKTGYTSKAQCNLVAIAKDQGRTLIVVLMKGPSSKERNEDAIALFDEAFKEEKKERVLYRADDMILKKQVKKKIVPCRLLRDCHYSFYPSEEVEIKGAVEWVDRDNAFSKAGEVIGYLRVSTVDGLAIDSVPIVAEKTLEKQSKWPYVKVIVALFLFGAILQVLRKLLKKYFQDALSDQSQEK